MNPDDPYWNWSDWALEERAVALHDKTPPEKFGFCIYGKPLVGATRLIGQSCTTAVIAQQGVWPKH